MSILSTLFRPVHVAGDQTTRAMLIGTADTVRELRRALKRSERNLRIVGCVLLHPQHHTGAIGLPVLGTVDRLDLIVKAHRIHTALLTVPAPMKQLADRIALRLRELDVTCRHMPTLNDQLDGRIGPTGACVDAAQLIDRPACRIDEQAVAATISDKRVLITGAGGSIGSELARIVARFDPAELILMERAENNLFEIDRHLSERFDGLARRAVLHDVADAPRTLALLRQYEPQLVLHTAAHKHVPMMEDHPRAALENNFFGTKAIADAADRAGAEQLVMISTDKAVRPGSVMGATKRLAELYVQHLDQHSETRFSMVRFGNVLGSACSVVPIWTQQLADGEPITVTDPRMTRYFMTIPEAAILVLQAAALDRDEATHQQYQGAMVFLLDMGQPVRISDMAERFIALAGLQPHRDVDVSYTGARPGEKVHEELAYDDEDKLATAHESVDILNTAPPDARLMQQVVLNCEAMRHVDDRQAVVAALREALDQLRVVTTGDLAAAEAPSAAQALRRPA